MRVRTRVRLRVRVRVRVGPIALLPHLRWSRKVSDPFLSTPPMAPTWRGDNQVTVGPRVTRTRLQHAR